ncbi:MAG: hypothetical protein LBL99_02285 [Holosporaceae bacterium]|jgi:hypothetical protein|nr:hypothetical protein [Holosporaceae bacterium]
MKKFFVEVLKLTFFIALALGAIYITGYWKPFMREVDEALSYLLEHFGYIMDHFGFAHQQISSLVKHAS